MRGLVAAQDTTSEPEDNCSWALRQPFKFQTLRDCFDKIPSLPNRKGETLLSVRGYAQFYVYTEMNIKTPEPYDIEVNLMKRLDDLILKDFKNDYEFQRALMQIFIDGKDAHTIYAPPRCYSEISLFLPFPLTSHLVDGKQRILVDSFSTKYAAIARDYEEIFPEEKEVTTAYKGWTVMKIENKDPLVYLRDLGNTISYSHDSSARFNFLLRQGWFARSLLRDLLPNKESLELVVRNPTDGVEKIITIRFYAKAMYPSSSENTFRARCGYTAPSPPDPTDPTRSEMIEDSQTTEAHSFNYADSLRFITDSITQGAWNDALAEGKRAAKQTLSKASFLGAFGRSIIHLFRDGVRTKALYERVSLPGFDIYAERFKEMKKAQATRLSLMAQLRESPNNLEAQKRLDALLDPFESILDLYRVFPQSNVPLMADVILNTLLENSTSHKDASTTEESMEDNDATSSFTSSSSSSSSNDDGATEEGERAPNDNDYVVVHKSADDEFIILEAEGRPTILQVSTFMPHITPQTATEIQAISDYLRRLIETVKILEEHKTEKLILDLRGNTGGVICFGYLLLNFLSPYAPLDMSPSFDQKVTPLGREMNCPYDLATRLTVGLAETRASVSGDWYTGGPNVTRNGVEAQFSKKTLISCQLIFLLANIEQYNPKLKFEPSDLVILTDGTCGSTCGMVVQVSQYLHLAKVVAQGGFHNQYLTVASFKGAAVFQSDAMYVKQRNNPLCMVSPQNMIPDFPSTAMMTWSWLEGYPYVPRTSVFDQSKLSATTPMEFVRIDPDFRINDWTFDPSDTSPYPLVIPMFDRCKEWEFKRDDTCHATTKHGVAGHPCKYDAQLGYGTSFLEECVTFQCEERFYLNDEGTECLPMPETMDSFAIIIYIASIQAIILLILAFTVVTCCVGLNTLGLHLCIRFGYSKTTRNQYQIQDDLGYDY